MVNHLKKILSVGFAVLFLARCSSAVVFAQDGSQETYALASFDCSYTAYDYSSGLNTNTVNVIKQDADGCIWVGTDNGLYKYNAKYFERISFENDDISNCDISSLSCDSNGNLWIGTRENGLFVLRDDAAQAFDTEGYISQNITDIEIDISGNAVVAAGNGVITINAQNLGISLLSDELTPADKCIIDICVANDGAVWCLTDNASLYFLSNGSKALVDLDGQDGQGFVSDEIPSCISACGSGRIYVGTESDEIIYFDPVEDGSFDSGVIKFEGAGRVYSLVEDSLSRVWICTQNGLGRISGDEIYSVSTQLSGAVKCSFADNQGNVWFGSENEGMLKYTINRFVNLSTSAGIYGKIANSVAVYNNRLYIATNDGLVIYDALENGAVIENEITQLLENVKINCLLTLENGNLLIGTDEKYGLITYNAGTDSSWSIFNSENGLDGQSVLSVSILSDNSIAVGTEKSVCVIENAALKNKYNINYPATALSCDESGRIYAATENGAYVISNGQLQLLHQELADKHIYDIYVAGSSDIIISCDNEMYLYSGNTLTDISSLFDDNTVIIDVIDDGSGNLIFAAADDIYTATLDDVKKNKRCAKYCGNQNAGSSLTFGSQCSFLNNVLYVCTIDGVVAVKDIISDYQPKIIINSISIDGKALELSFDETIKLDSDVNNIEIDASVLSYIGESSLTYYLDGFDDSPTTVNSDGLIIYSNLDGGRYTLKIYGTDANGIKTNVISIELSKRNIWYESPVFWIVTVLSVAVISFLVSMFYIVQKLEKEEMLQSRQADLSIQAISAVAETIDARSNVMKGHSKRVALYSVEVARRLKCTDDFKESLYCAALLHDIGNIGVSDEVLVKPHKLTPEEMSLVHRHVQIGGDVLNKHDALRDLSDAVLYHHERYDGMGYCGHLAGEGIPLSARIIFACESLDAMMTEKPYRPVLNRERIINEFRVGSGTQFDPDIAQTVIKMIESGFKPE